MWTQIPCFLGVLNKERLLHVVLMYIDYLIQDKEQNSEELFSPHRLLLFDALTSWLNFYMQFFPFFWRADSTQYI